MNASDTLSSNPWYIIYTLFFLYFGIRVVVWMRKSYMPNLAFGAALFGMIFIAGKGILAPGWIILLFVVLAIIEHFSPIALYRRLLVDTHRWPDPSDTTLWQAASECLEKEDWTNAERNLIALSDKEPRNNKALYWLGVAQGKQGRNPEAEMTFRSLVELRPKCGAALSGLAQALLLVGKKDEARQLMARAFRIDPGWPQVRDVWRQLKKG
jgi:tetratricopeptide (TPR) repeat protein